MNQRVQATRGDDDLGDERRDCGAGDPQRGNERDVRREIRGERESGDDEIRALAVPSDHLVRERVVEKEQRQGEREDRKRRRRIRVSVTVDRRDNP
jgi:hypothetical protein